MILPGLIGIQIISHEVKTAHSIETLIVEIATDVGTLHQLLCQY